MQHLKTLYSLTLGVVLAGAGVVAQAADVGRGYVSVYIGQADVEADIDGLDEDVEGDDTAFRIGGGYRVNEHFAIEGFYIDNGEADDTVNSGGFVFDASIESTAFQVQAVGFLPVSDAVELYGKAGLGRWDAEFCEELLVRCYDDDGTDLVFGFGAGFDLGRRVDLRVEYEFAEFEDADFTTLMVGLDLGF